MSRSYNDNPPGSEQCRGCEGVLFCAPGCAVRQHPRGEYFGPEPEGLGTIAKSRGKRRRWRCLQCRTVFVASHPKKYCGRKCRSIAYVRANGGWLPPNNPELVAEAA